MSSEFVLGLAGVKTVKPNPHTVNLKSQTAESLRYTKPVP